MALAQPASGAIMVAEDLVTMNERSQSTSPRRINPMLGRVLLLMAFAILLPCGRAHADDRLLVAGSINGKPVRLAFDTGASELMLTSKAATRLGLAFTNGPNDSAPGPGRINLGTTEPCVLCVGTNTIKTAFGVFEIPNALPVDFDGLIGWKSIADSVLWIDALKGEVIAMPSVPVEAATWAKLQLETNSDTLRMEVPSDRGTPSVILIDTGDSDGVNLPSDKWQDWKAAHSNQPTTFDSYYTPAAGLVVVEVGWATELTLGPFTMTGVPVMAANVSDIGGDSTNFLATFGLAALRRLNVIVDRANGFAYVRARATPPSPYEHNRLGAVFAPVNLETEDLIGHVAEGGPAWHAGIRNGDVLTRIGDLDVTKWRTDPHVLPLSRFWFQPPATKLHLALRRGDKEFTADVVLRQILGPIADADSKQAH
jgi:hypothetical protein